MHYMILFYEPSEIFEARNQPPMAGAYWGAWTAYIKAMAESGVVVSGNGLQPPHTATTIRVRGGERQVQDGPVAGTKEQLGGYFVIDVPTVEDALAWAARSPAAADGAVEVRPVLPPMTAG